MVRIVLRYLKVAASSNLLCGRSHICFLRMQPIIRIADDIPFRLNYAVRQDGTLHIGDSFTVEVSRKIDGRDLTQQDLAEFLLEQGFEITQFEKEYQISVPF